MCLSEVDRAFSCGKPSSQAENALLRKFMALSKTNLCFKINTTQAVQHVDANNQFHLRNLYQWAFTTLNHFLSDSLTQGVSETNK